MSVVKPKLAAVAGKQDCKCSGECGFFPAFGIKTGTQGGVHGGGRKRGGDWTVGVMPSRGMISGISKGRYPQTREPWTGLS